MLSAYTNAIWQACDLFGPPPSEHQMHASLNHQIYYHRITKCGSTFAERFLAHLDGVSIPSKVQWAGNTGICFSIVRNPIERFFSLYFDKVLTSPNQKPHGIARSMLKLNLINPDAEKDLSKHRQNCLNLLGYINQTIQGIGGKTANPHWRPQAFRLSRIAKKDVHLVTLDGVNWQLPLVLADHLPTASVELRKIGHQNVSIKPLFIDEILTPKLERIIRRIYAADERVYHEVHNFWKQQAGPRLNYGTEIKQTARGWLAFDRQALRA